MLISNTSTTNARYGPTLGRRAAQKPLGRRSRREKVVAGNSSWRGHDVEQLYGNVDDMDVRLGWDAKEQMDNDSHCGAALDTLALGALARPAEVEPTPESHFKSDADKQMAIETANFGRRCLHELKYSHRDINLTAYQLLRNMLKIGHSKGEIVPRLQKDGVDAGKLIIDRIKPKSRINSCFLVDRQNNIVGIAGFTGDYSSYQNPSDAISSSGYIQASNLGAGWQELPRDEWVVMVNGAPADDSPLGVSVYRRAYTYYRMKRDAWAFYLKWLDTNAMPFTDIELPANAPDMYAPLPDGEPDIERGKVDAATAMYEWTLIARQGGVLVRPNGSKAALLHTGTSGDAYSMAIGVFNSQITQSILLQSLATGSSKTGAYALGQVHQDILDLAMRHYRRLATDALTRDIMGPLIRNNFPARYHHLIPSVSFGEVELNDFAAWAEACARLAQSGLLHPSQFPHIWAILGLPQADLKDFYRELANDDAILEKMREPQIGADGSTQPSIEEKYALQETGKRVSRNAGQKRAGRIGAAL